MTLYIAGSTVLGAGLGFLYQRVVGCRSGVCLITSNRWVATVYGGVMGYLMAR